MSQSVGPYLTPTHGHFKLMDLLDACVFMLKNGVPPEASVSIGELGCPATEFVVEAELLNITTMRDKRTQYVQGRKEVVLR